MKIDYFKNQNVPNFKANIVRSKAAKSLYDNKLNRSWGFDPKQEWQIFKNAFKSSTSDICGTFYVDTVKINGINRFKLNYKDNDQKILHGERFYLVSSFMRNAKLDLDKPCSYSIAQLLFSIAHSSRLPEDHPMTKLATKMINDFETKYFDYN